MKYDLSNPLHRVQATTRLDALCKRGRGVVELREVRHGRTDRQNKYLHVCIAYLALQVGETAEYAKREWYKRAANRDVYEYAATDRLTGMEVTRLRSSRELSTDELTLTLERFRNWSARVAGVYIPSPDEHELVERMEVEVERAREWL